MPAPTTFMGMQFTWNNGADWKVIKDAAVGMGWVQLGPLLKPFRRVLYWTRSIGGTSGGTNNVICSSTNGGITIYNNHGDGHNFYTDDPDFFGCMDLAVSPSDSLTCYALMAYKVNTDGYGLKVMKTTDAGDTWTDCGLQPLAGHFFTFQWAHLAIDPADPSSVWVSYYNGSSVGGHGRVGAAHSADAGASWTLVEDYESAAFGDAPYAGPYNIVVSNGAALISIRQNVSFGAPDAKFKVVGGDYIDSPANPTGSYYYLTSSKRGMVAAGEWNFNVGYPGQTEGARVMFSVDGQTWEDAAAAGLPTYVQYISFGFDDKTLLVDIFHDGLYRSLDAGGSFELMSVSSGNYTGKSLADPLNEKYTWHVGNIDFSNENGIFVSKDGGATWLVRRTNTSDHPPFAIGVMPPDT